MNLTGRQKFICACISKGLQNDEVALELKVSRSTMDHEVARIKKVLGVNTRTGIARKWVEWSDEKTAKVR